MFIYIHVCIQHFTLIVLIFQLHVTLPYRLYDILAYSFVDRFTLSLLFSVASIISNIL